MTKLAPEWVRTSDPVIRSPARYRWTTAPAHPTIINNEQVYDCGRNIAGNNVSKNDNISMSNYNVQHEINANYCRRNMPGINVTKNDNISMSNDNVKHEIKADAKNNIDIHNDNLITISILDKQHTALIDTGANLNCISTETLKNCPQSVKRKFIKCNRKCTLADGDTLVTTGTVAMYIKIDGRRFDVNFSV